MSRVLIGNHRGCWGQGQNDGFVPRMRFFLGNEASQWHSIRGVLNIFAGIYGASLWWYYHWHHDDTEFACCRISTSFCVPGFSKTRNFGPLPFPQINNNWSIQRFISLRGNLHNLHNWRMINNHENILATRGFNMDEYWADGGRPLTITIISLCLSVWVVSVSVLLGLVLLTDSPLHPRHWEFIL